MMGIFFTKKMLLVLTPILLLHLLISSSYGASFNSNETRAWISEDQPLSLCTMARGRILISVSLQTVENLSTYGEADKDCLNLYGLLECSNYHPRVGIHSGSSRICASFCDRVFEACSEAYFTNDFFINQVLVPCGSREGIICGKASKWVSNGTELCNALGFTVQEADDSVEEPCFESEIKSSLEPMVSDDSVEEPFHGSESSLEEMVSDDYYVEEPCYGSKSSLEPIVELESLTKTEKFAWFQDLQKRVKKMTLGYMIYCVVTVFAIGINVFYRWCYMRQMLAIERNARR